MAEDLKPVVLTIKVNKQTGAIEVAGAEIAKMADAAAKAQGPLGGLGAAFKNLAPSLAAFGTAAGLTAFLSSSVNAAIEHTENLRKLSFALSTNGISFQDNAEKIQKWQTQIGEATRFAGDDYLAALGRASRATSDLGQAHEAVRTAMGLSVGTGKTLEESLGIITGLLGGNRNAIRGLSGEFGSFISVNDTAQSALSKLQTRFSGVAEAEAGAAKGIKQAQNAYKEFQEFVGTGLLESFKNIWIWAKKAGEAVQGFFGLSAGTAKSGTALTIEALEKQREKFQALIALQSSSNKGSAQQAAIYQVELKKVEAALDRLQAKHVQVEEAKTAATGKGQDLRAQKGRAENENLRRLLDGDLDSSRRHAEADLAIKNQSNAQRVEIIRASMAEQEAIVNEGRFRTVFQEGEKEQILARIRQEGAAKAKAIEDELVVERVKAAEAWFTQNTDIHARVAETARTSADQLSAGFGSALANTLVNGKSFSEQMQAVFKNLATQIIADIIRIEAKAALLAALGIGTGGAAGGTSIIAKLFGFAEGGRVTGPTPAMIGEGREPETVVPDSQARGFAMGVMAGRNAQSGGGAGGAAGSGSVSFGDININIAQPINFNDPGQARELASALAEYLRNNNSITQAIAVRAANLATRYPNRAY